MSGAAVAALALAAAVLVGASPRRRLRPVDRSGGGGRVVLVGLAGCGALAAAVCLPGGTCVAAAVLAATAAARYRRRLRQRRARAESDALESALDILVAELRIGDTRPPSIVPPFDFAFRQRDSEKKRDRTVFSTRVREAPL